MDGNFFVHSDAVSAFGFDWGQLALTVGPTVNGAIGFSGGVVSLQPGQGHARHNHPEAEEIIFIVAGTGEQMIEDEQGQPMVHPVSAGVTIYVPQARYHSTQNTSDALLQLFVVYSPAGPENGLRDAPDFRLLPPKRK